MKLKSQRLKGHRQLWGCADLDTSFQKSSAQLGTKVQLESRFNFRIVLLDFQSFTENHVFECLFAHPAHIWLKTLKTVFIASPLHAI